MTGPISVNRWLGSLKEAASWPGADRNTVVTLATSLVAARADEEGSRYFQDLAERNPADPTEQALAGFFAVRAGRPGGRRPGVRTRGPRPVPGLAAPRRVPGPGPRLPGARAAAAGG